LKTTDQKQKQITIMCQLGKHQWYQSKQMKKNQKEKEADKMYLKAVKVSCNSNIIIILIHYSITF